jgi:hypothetical protein
MAAIPWGDIAIIATLLAIAYRGGKLIGAIPSQIADALNKHEDDCLSHKSIKRTAAEMVAKPRAQPPEANP